MARPDARVLGHHLRRLDGDAFAAFVADLWTARGYETRRDGGRVRAARGGTALTIAAGPVGRDAADADVDAVVTPRVDPRLGGTDARVVDAADLRDALWYALDRETARALCARHLGAPPADLRPSLRRRVRGRLRAGATEPAVGAAALVLLLGVVGGAVVTFGPGATDAQNPTVDGASLPANASRDALATATRTPGRPDASGATTTPERPELARGVLDDSGPPGAEVLPPGLRRTGVTDLPALVAAHRRGLHNRSYTLRVDLVRPRDGEPNATRLALDADVAAVDGRYLLIECVRPAAGGESRGVQSVYYDGTDRFVSTGPAADATDRGPIETGNASLGRDPDAFGGTLVARWLRTARSDVTGRVVDDGRTYHRIVGSGWLGSTEAGDVVDYEVTALVAESGLVVEGRVAYVVDTGRGSYPVRLAWTYDRVGETRMGPPLWCGDRVGRPATAAP